MLSSLFPDRPRVPRWAAALTRVPVFAAVFGGLGLVLLLIAGARAVRNQLYTRSGPRAPGTVTGLVESVSWDPRRRRNTVSYGPRVRFRLLEGRELEIVGLGANPPVYNEVDAVTVLYPPDHPQHGIIDSHQELRDGPIAVGAFGALFSLVGFVLWRARI